MEGGSGPPTGGQGSSRGLLWGLIVAVIVLAAVVAGCSGEEQVTVPDLVGLEEAEARGVVNGLGLELGEVERETVDASSTRVGTVLSQQPSPGREVDSGTLVELVVAEAPDEETEDDGAETAPSGGSNGGSGMGAGSGSGREPEAEPEPEPEAEEASHTVAAASGSSDYTNPAFTTISSQLQLTVVVSSASGDTVRFTVSRTGGASRVIGVRATPSTRTHTGRPFSMPPGECRVAVDSPADGEWSIKLREWR